MAATKKKAAAKKRVAAPKNNFPKQLFVRIEDSEVAKGGSVFYDAHETKVGAFRGEDDGTRIATYQLLNVEEGVTIHDFTLVEAHA